MNKVFLLLGPTASGKSEISFKLAKDFPFEIINADLFSIYEGLDIGTAKPCQEFLKTIKHYLIDTIKPNMKYNVSEFCLDAYSCVKTIFSRKKYPLIVGGSMMYVYQLLNGLSHEYNLIESDKKIIKYIFKNYSNESIYNSLKSDKSSSIEKINSNDTYRIEKLIERLISTQNHIKKFNGLYNENALEIIIIFIDIKNRDILRKNIYKRTEHMLNTGLINEVKQLVKKYNLSRDSQSMKAIGYKEVMNYLANSNDPNNLVELIALSTQQLAKRQITWRNKFKIDFSIDYPNIDYFKLEKFVSESLR